MSENDENHLIAERRAKLAKLRERGTAFPNDFRRDALAADIVTAYGEKSAEALEAAPVPVKVAGRMRAKRVMGKASFAKLEDSSGAIQVFLQQQALGEAVRRIQRLGCRRCDRRRGNPVPHQNRRAVGAGPASAFAHQVAAAAAR